MPALFKYQPSNINSQFPIPNSQLSNSSFHASAQYVILCTCLCPACSIHFALPLYISRYPLPPLYISCCLMLNSQLSILNFQFSNTTSQTSTLKSLETHIAGSAKKSYNAGHRYGCGLNPSSHNSTGTKIIKYNSRSAERPLLKLTSTKISQTLKSQLPLFSMTCTKITIKISPHISWTPLPTLPQHMEILGISLYFRHPKIIRK